ncbi:MAG: hypothetical protein ACLFU2_10110 [Opitutales bacterium]
MIAFTDIRAVAALPLDGFIVQRPDYHSPEALAELKQRGRPWVALPQSGEHDVPTLTWDNRSGIIAIGDHLVSLGPRATDRRTPHPRESHPPPAQRPDQ